MEEKILDMWRRVEAETERTGFNTVTGLFYKWWPWDHEGEKIATVAARLGIAPEAVRVLIIDGAK